ncbi:Protein of unknown function DUF620 [Dillenia turbinata]|uniref:Uncharacterized protein n=1 Tax=Dillenia turbinata TaxID=194707 RepID=A0AAN8VGF0_9MAGN
MQFKTSASEKISMVPYGAALSNSNKLSLRKRGKRLTLVIHSVRRFKFMEEKEIQHKILSPCMQTQTQVYSGSPTACVDTRDWVGSQSSMNLRLTYRFRFSLLIVMNIGLGAGQGSCDLSIALLLKRLFANWGLDPRSTANLFSNSICIGEKTINEEDCFILKLEAESPTLRARSSINVEIIQHTVWGYFSQKTGLLVKLEDSHLLRIKTSGNDSIFWETTMEPLVQDYRTIDGINIAHAGGTMVSLFRFGETSEEHSRIRMEEVWTTGDIDFNIKGLSIDNFLPPSDLKKDNEEQGNFVSSDTITRFKYKVSSAPLRISASKVVAVDAVDGGHDNDNDFNAM